MSRFEVLSAPNGRYQVIDTSNGRACMYSGAATCPPKYVGDGHKLRYEDWGNPLSARGFAQKLEKANT